MDKSCTMMEKMISAIQDNNNKLLDLLKEHMKEMGKEKESKKEDKGDKMEM